MTEPPAPQRIAVVWSPEARVDVRAIARDAAMQILHCLDRYLANRTGDVKKLKSPLTGFRLRCGDYRVFFSETSRPSTSPPSATAAKPTADSPPALRTLPAERMGSSLPSRWFSRCLFRHLAALLTRSTRRVEASSWERTWNVWKAADPNVPILRQAKAEYANLQDQKMLRIFEARHCS